MASNYYLATRKNANAVGAFITCSPKYVMKGSLARFENKKYSTLKNALAYYNAGVVPVSRRIGSW
jgi:hypothetical protein